MIEYRRYVIVPVFEGGREPPGGAHGSSGDYQVTIVFGVPGIESVVTTLSMEALEAGGDSLIASPGASVEIDTGSNTPRSWVLQVNENGHLARAVATIHAESLADAEAKIHDEVSAVISRLAFETNAPVEVQGLMVREVATGTAALAGMVAARTTTGRNVIGTYSPESAAMLAAYREGLTSLTPIYQALSFFKVTEGVNTFYTKAVRQAEKEGAAAPPDPLAAPFPAAPAEVTDVDTLDPMDYPELAGKSLRDVWNSYRKSLRDMSAHIVPGKELIVADRYADLSRSREAIPALRYVARKGLDAHLART